MQEVRRALRLALALALAAAAPAASAVSLGEAQVRSALGEALDVRIPFTIPEGSSVDAACFALVREPVMGTPALGEGVLTIERRRGEVALRIRTVTPVIEPAVAVNVRAACRGGAATTREYSFLLDPRPGAAIAVSTPTVAARLNAIEGETLASLAAKIFPSQPQSRRAYVTALRDINPDLARQDENAASATGAPIALPDPRSIGRVHPTPPRSKARNADAPPVAAIVRRPAISEATRTVPTHENRPAVKRTEPSRPRVAQAPAISGQAQRRVPGERAVSAPSFQLKLSSAEVDLSRSRRVDDRMRAQLRERLLVLDADDQVAAMLSMRHNLTQLEARVADMQLKLDSMPALLAARAATPAPGATPARAPPAVATSGSTAPAMAAAGKSTPAQAPVGAESVSPASRPETSPPARNEPTAGPAPAAPAVQPAPVKATAETVPIPPVAQGLPATPAAAPASQAPEPAPVAPAPEEGLPGWLWGVAVALAAAALLILWAVRRRSRATTTEEWTELQQGESVDPTVLEMDPAEEPIEVAAEVRPELASDASLATHLAGNSGELRRRYIEERFPEIQNGAITLGDPASVIKGARLFYEDGALTRSVELLQFVIEDNPAEVRQWLALFEIFRLERLSGEFAHLAQRFREHHGKTEYWRKVQYFGREIDPGNPLYREEPVNTLETIGPREAKRLAAGSAAAASFDPIAENWLNAPMDFENEVLANELRRRLMDEAYVNEQDLAANPMPALRSVEMFTVA